MQVLSVNLAQPQTIEYRGKAVSTGIFKQPSNQPILLERLGFVGDVQVDRRYHGGPDQAAYAYDASYYDHWRSVTGRDDFGWGQFGENLTITEMPDDKVWIGDRYRIGEAVVEVSHPRVPCFKLGVRMGDPRFVKLFHNECKVGFYVRVLQLGHVGPDDAIDLEDRDPQSMSVADIYRIMHIDTEDIEAAHRASHLARLTMEWRERLRQR